MHPLQIPSLAIATFLCLAAPLAADAPGEAPAACPAVFRVDALDGHGRLLRTGTAFALSTGRLATNDHVVTGAARVFVTGQDGVRRRVRSMVTGAGVGDYAILHLGRRSDDGLTTQLAPPKFGAPAVLLAYVPARGFRALPGTIEEGPLAHVLGAYELSVPLVPGMSGAPVVDAACRVVAVATFAVEGSAYATFALPAVPLLTLSTKKGPADE